MKKLKIEIEINTNQFDPKYFINQESLNQLKNEFIHWFAQDGLQEIDVIKFELVEDDENPNRTDDCIG